MCAAPFGLLPIHPWTVASKIFRAWLILVTLETLVICLAAEKAEGVAEIVLEISAHMLSMRNATFVLVL